MCKSDMCEKIMEFPTEGRQGDKIGKSGINGEVARGRKYYELNGGKRT